MIESIWVEVLEGRSIGTFRTFDEAEKIPMLPDEPGQVTGIACAVKRIYKTSSRA